MRRISEFGVVAFFVFMVGIAFGAYAFTTFSTNPVMQLGAVSESLVFANPEPQNPSASVLFLGDLMLDRHVALKMAEYGRDYPFQDLKEFLKSADMTVANAEGVFSHHKSVTKGIKNPPLRFTFETYTLPLLHSLGFTAFSQANNHSFDFGKEVSEESQKEITAAGIGVFGDYYNENPGPLLYEVGDEVIALIGFNEFSYRNKEKVIEAIEAAKAQEPAAFAVVFAHWGVEYQPEESTYQKTLAHEFINAGADAIIGMHPHVIQPIEIYQGKAIFYSLGNFVFDQGFGETSKGLAVRLNLSKERVIYDLVPLYVGIGHTRLAVEEEKVKALESLNNPEGVIILPR